MNNHCRISRVFPKSGGVIERLRLPERDQQQGRFLSDARAVSGHFKDGEMVGHVVIAWNKDSEFSCAYQSGAQGISKTLLPSWTADVLRRSMIETGSWS